MVLEVAAVMFNIHKSAGQENVNSAELCEVTVSLQRWRQVTAAGTRQQSSSPVNPNLTRK